MPLPPGPPLQLPLDVDAYMAGQRSAALLVVHDGKLRLERYGLGFDDGGRWTSFSIAKSVTSTLVGAAIKDGHISSIEDKVSAYIPEMKGSAYDDVSIRQLLTMTSGVKWNEDYADPNSDVARFNSHKPDAGVDALVSYLRRLPREAPAGTRWLYSTGETNLVGVLLGRATKKPLATYLSEKIWVPAGMEQQATWILNRSGQEISGCCIQAAPRDFARIGVFILNGAGSAGKASCPTAGWPSHDRRADIGRPARLRLPVVDLRRRHLRRPRHLRPGIFIDPKRKVVIVSNANWGGGATDRVASEAREAFYRTVLKAVDDEARPASRRRPSPESARRRSAGAPAVTTSPCSGRGRELVQTLAAFRYRSMDRLRFPPPRQLLRPRPRGLLRALAPGGRAGAEVAVLQRAAGRGARPRRRRARRRGRRRAVRRQRGARRRRADRPGLRRTPVRRLLAAARRRPGAAARRGDRSRRPAPRHRPEGLGPDAVLARRRRQGGGRADAARGADRRGDARPRHPDHARARGRRHRPAGVSRDACCPARC